MAGATFGLLVKAGATAWFGSYLIAVNAMLLALVIVMTARYSDVRRRQIRNDAVSGEQTKRLLRHLREISEARTQLSSFALQNEHDPAQRDERLRLTDTFLQSLVEKTRDMFEDYVQRTCAVSIKVLVAGEHGRPYIQTYLRDGQSARLRSRAGSPHVYPIGLHSPFFDIVAGQTEGDVFLENDLVLAEEAGAYLNGNPSWKRLYRAALVVPIKHPDGAANENIVGFLCIDSLKGRFDEVACVSMAKIVANCVFLAFLELSILGVVSNGENNENASKGRRDYV